MSWHGQSLAGSTVLAVILSGFALLDAAPDPLAAECPALLHVHAVVVEIGGVEAQGLDQVAAAAQPARLVTGLPGFDKVLRRFFLMSIQI